MKLIIIYLNLNNWNINIKYIYIFSLYIYFLKLIIIYFNFNFNYIYINLKKKKKKAKPNDWRVLGTQPQSLGKTQIGFQMWNSIWVYSCGPHFWVLFFGSHLQPMWLNFMKPKMGLTKWVLFLHQCGCSK